MAEDRGREGAEERESMQRSSVTQQYTQILLSLRL